jgi:hypothetical protein
MSQLSVNQVVVRLVLVVLVVQLIQLVQWVMVLNHQLLLVVLLGLLLLEDLVILVIQ